MDWTLLAVLFGGMLLMALLDVILMRWLGLRAVLAATAAHRASIRARKSARAAETTARELRLQHEFAVLMYRRQVTDDARRRARVRELAAPSDRDLFVTNGKSEA